MKRWRLWQGLSLVALCIVLLYACPSSEAQGGWSSPTNLSSSAADTMGGALAVDQSARVHAVWSEGGTLWHSVRSEDAWTEVSMLAEGSQPALTTDGAGGVHLVFVAASAQADDVFYASWDATEGWQLPVNVSETDGDSAEPDVAAMASELSIVWSEPSGQETLIYHARSTDGALWASAPIPNAQGNDPAVIYDAQGHPVVVWEDVFDTGLPLEIFAASETGSGWTLPVDVSYSPGSPSYAPALAAGSEAVSLAWIESADDETQVLLATWSEAGWDLPQPASDGTVAHSPALAYDATGTGHLVWGADGTLRHRSWSPDTDVWASADDVATDQAGTSNLRLAAGADLHLVWLAGSGARDLYYSSRTATPAAMYQLDLPLLMTR